MTAPVLVVVGSEDALTPPSFSETLVAGLPDAKLAVIPGAGHLSALERPHEFAAAVGPFLARRLDP
jgi:pimeloyl-ACP methyl ester carboxylesterase